MPEKRKPRAAAPTAALTTDEAINAVRDEIAAVPATALVPVNLDIPAAVGVVIGALPRILGLRPALAQLPDFDLAAVDRLEALALAAWGLHLDSRRKTSRAAMVALLDEAKRLRSSLLLEATHLAERRVFDRRAVGRIREGQGHLDTANDLLALANLFQARWTDLAGRTFVTPEEVSRASSLAVELLEALGRRERGSLADPRSPAGMRARAWALLVRAYDEVRRGVVYLRWHAGDAELVAPTLYRARARRTSRTTSAPEASTPPAEGP